MFRLLSIIASATYFPLKIALEIPSAVIGSAKPAASPIKKTLFFTNPSVLGAMGIWNPCASCFIISLMPRVSKYFL